MQKTLLSIIAAILLYACSTGVAYDNSVPTGSPQWSMDQPASFDINITDTGSVYQIGIRVRNNEQYAYQNLWLFVSEIRPDSSIWRDTVEFYLADDYGRWYGKGLSTLHSALFLYKDSVTFPAPGRYTYNIRHGMRDENLSGITDIGMKIVKKQ